MFLFAIFFDVLQDEFLKGLKGEGFPPLCSIDVPVLCTLVKHFFKKLNHTLISPEDFEKYTDVCSEVAPGEFPAELKDYSTMSSESLQVQINLMLLLSNEFFLLVIDTEARLAFKEMWSEPCNQERGRSSRQDGHGRLSSSARMERDAERCVRAAGRSSSMPGNVSLILQFMTTFSFLRIANSSNG